MTINLLINPERLVEELHKRLPFTISNKENSIRLDPPWNASFVQSGLLINGLVYAEWKLMSGVVAYGTASFSANLSLGDFPELQIAIERVEFPDRPKLKILGFLNVPIKRMAEHRLKSNLPVIKRTLNHQLNAEVDKQLPQIAEQLQSQLPHGCQLQLAGLNWTLEKLNKNGQFELKPAVHIKSGDFESQIALKQPWQNEERPIEFEMTLTLVQINTLIQERIQNQQFKTPAGTFTLHTIVASIVNKRLQFLIDFQEDKNGQLDVIGDLQIIDAGKGLAFDVVKVNWRSVNILKQGILAIFQDKVKNQINEVLKLEQNKIQQLINGQLKMINERAFPNNAANLTSLIAQPHFQKAQVVDNGIQISATLAAQVNITLE